MLFFRSKRNKEKNDLQGTCIPFHRTIVIIFQKEKYCICKSACFSLSLFQLSFHKQRICRGHFDIQSSTVHRVLAAILLVDMKSHETEGLLVRTTGSPLRVEYAMIPFFASNISIYLSVYFHKVDLLAISKFQC